MYTHRVSLAVLSVLQPEFRLISSITVGAARFPHSFPHGDFLRTETLAVTCSRQPAFTSRGFRVTDSRVRNIQTERVFCVLLSSCHHRTLLQVPLLLSRLPHPLQWHHSLWHSGCVLLGLLRCSHTLGLRGRWDGPRTAWARAGQAAGGAAC